MNYYEIIYIVHPALQAGHLDDIIAQVNKKISNLKGKVLYQDNWGKKKLSYLIQKQKYGTYVLIQCMIDGKSINEISTDFELNTNILRHLVSKITEDDIFEQKNTDEVKKERPSSLSVEAGDNKVSESDQENNNHHDDESQKQENNDHDDESQKQENNDHDDESQKQENNNHNDESQEQENADNDSVDKVEDNNNETGE